MDPKEKKRLAALENARLKAEYMKIMNPQGKEGSSTKKKKQAEVVRKKEKKGEAGAEKVRLKAESKKIVNDSKTKSLAAKDSSSSSKKRKSSGSTKSSKYMSDEENLDGPIVVYKEGKRVQTLFGKKWWKGRITMTETDRKSKDITKVGITYDDGAYEESIWPDQGVIVMEDDITTSSTKQEEVIKRPKKKEVTSTKSKYLFKSGL